ncbi:unnamed protein product [Didymodactylos carnosus]|uniref:Uncharacterized protein n=1 Tax=Didymodactylos carnosus TaxID=1234261 RepID=A0A8S2F1D3_9BILA|nr:unnamed protein product [Didymodactylos carnosus]CAF4177165.1 unnamed protein product [Didymodactylos carnosus]
MLTEHQNLCDCEGLEHRFIKALTISDEAALGQNIQHYYLIRNHRVNQYTDTFIKSCPTLDKFRIESTSTDRYGLATPQKLREMLKEENNNESPLNSSASSVSSSSVATPISSPLQQKRRVSLGLVQMETPCIIYGDENSDYRRSSTPSSSASPSIDSEDDNEIEVSCTACSRHDH